MWLEVGETEDSMVEAMCKEEGCGLRKERQRTVWWTQCVRSQDQHYPTSHNFAQLVM